MGNSLWPAKGWRAKEPHVEDEGGTPSGRTRLCRKTIKPSRAQNISYPSNISDSSSSAADTPCSQRNCIDALYSPLQTRHKVCVSTDPRTHCAPKAHPSARVLALLGAHPRMSDPPSNPVQGPSIRCMDRSGAPASVLEGRERPRHQSSAQKRHNDTPHVRPPSCWEDLLTLCVGLGTGEYKASHLAPVNAASRDASPGIIDEWGWGGA